QMATMVMMGLIVTFGTVSLAAHNLGLQAESISYMPGAGFGIAATTLIGHSLGAQNPGLGKRYFKEILKWGVLVSGFTSLLLFFFNIHLMTLLTDQREVIVLGAEYLWLMSFTQIASLVTGIIGGTLRSAGDIQAPMVIAGVGMWALRIPLSFVFGASWGLGLGVQGVWYAMIVDLFVRLVLAIWRYRTLRWDTVKVI
ncbi:MAG: MATE family efflux transporter, partial [Symbiobacteriaceae bacterium]|nr:MATE family efflux transporter [Symbiobacteriaceae bacterium]